jgi:FMN reductase
VVELSVVVGNPKPRSRTFIIADAVASRVATATGATVTQKIDLCDHASDLFTWPHEGLAALNAQVAAGDLAVIASPTYKATYTGLLKAFLDRYANNGLAGVTLVPVMTGGSAHHAMAVDTALRPLLVELGASVPSRGLYFVMTQFDELDSVVDAWAQANMQTICRAVAR